MAERGWMEPQRVYAVADKLEDMAGILRIVNTVMEAQILILQTTAFIGNVGGAVWARYLDVLQPAIERAEQRCRDLSEKARSEAKQWEDAAGIG